MSPGDTAPLPCDGMLEETDIAIATYEGVTENVLSMLRRHRESLKSCRTHCWLRNPTTNTGG